MPIESPQSLMQRLQRKRTQRKKDARLKPTEEMETDTSNTTTNADSTDYDRRKILLFNCGEYLDFESGEVTVRRSQLLHTKAVCLKDKTDTLSHSLLLSASQREGRLRVRTLFF